MNQFNKQMCKVSFSRSFFWHKLTLQNQITDTQQAKITDANEYHILVRVDDLQRNQMNSRMINKVIDR